jgi:hypothetical protein
MPTSVPTANSVAGDLPMCRSIPSGGEEEGAVRRQRAVHCTDRHHGSRGYQTSYGEKIVLYLATE